MPENEFLFYFIIFLHTKMIKNYKKISKIRVHTSKKKSKNTKIKHRKIFFSVLKIDRKFQNNRYIIE